MKVKKAIRKIHRWLGLLSGLVVFVSMLAAAVFVWEKELRDWYYGDLVFVREVRTEALPVSTLLEAARHALPGKPLTDIDVSRDPRRSYVFSNYKKSATPGWTWMSGMEYMDQVFVDQYTGVVLGVVDKRYDWIFMTRMLHQCLLIRQDIGHLIVGVATLVVFVMVFSGLVMWFPRNRAALRQRFTINWKAKWRRVTYDIHNVGGFYLYPVILLLAATGLVWTFTWWTNGIYRLLGTDPQHVWQTHAPLQLSSSGAALPIDKVFADVVKRRASWTTVGIGLPGSEEVEASREIVAYLRFNNGSGWDEWDTYYYHPVTARLHAAHLQENKTLGAKWRNSNYAIHVGSIYGLPSKLLMFAAALFCASLPVTGLMIWLGRRNKKRQDRSMSKPLPDRAAVRPRVRRALAREGV